MLVIIGIVFITVFVVVVLVMMAGGSSSAQEQKKALAVLDSALASNITATASDDMVDIRREELLSKLPWLNRWLIELDLAPRLRLFLYQSDLNLTVGSLLLMSAASAFAAAAIVYLRTNEIVISLLLGAVAATAPFGYVAHKRTQRFNAFEEKLPDALDLIVSALRAGHSLISGISVVASETTDPIRREFRVCFDEQNFGLDMRMAMENLTKRVPLQDVRMVVTAILIQKDSGGNLAEVLEKVASLIRDRFRLKRQIRVHTAQGRLTGWILAILPVILGLGIYLVNPEHISILWHRPVGIKMLWTAAGMTCVGALIIRKIVRVRI
jgi:tight adherence protein B